MAARRGRPSMMPCRWATLHGAGSSGKRENSLWLSTRRAGARPAGCVSGRRLQPARSPQAAGTQALAAGWRHQAQRQAAAGGVDDRPLKERLEDYMSREWQRIAVRIRRSDFSPDEVEDAALTLGCEASAVRTWWANALKRQGKSGTLDNVPARSLAAKQNARAAVAAEQAEAKAALAALPPPDWRAVFAVRCLSGDNPGRAHAWAELQAAGLNGLLEWMKRIVEHLDTRYVFHVRAVDLLRAALVTARALPVYQLAHLGPVAGAGSWWMLTVRDELRGTIEALAFDASALPNLRLRPQLVTEAEATAQLRESLLLDNDTAHNEVAGCAVLPLHNRTPDGEPYSWAYNVVGSTVLAAQAERLALDAQSAEYDAECLRNVAAAKAEREAADAAHRAAVRWLPPTMSDAQTAAMRALWAVTHTPSQPQLFQLLRETGLTTDSLRRFFGLLRQRLKTHPTNDPFLGGRTHGALCTQTAGCHGRLPGRTPRCPVCNMLRASADDA